MASEEASLVRQNCGTLTVAQKEALHEVLPKAGLVVSEKGNLTETLCKPKILPLKSITLQKLEEMEAKLVELNKQQPTAPQQQDSMAQWAAQARREDSMHMSMTLAGSFTAAASNSQSLQF